MVDALIAKAAQLKIATPEEKAVGRISAKMNFEIFSSGLNRSLPIWGW
jgi:hypothetical protein